MIDSVGDENKHNYKILNHVIVTKNMKVYIQLNKK